MFPNIPRAYIVRELDRADGVISAAIDRLILMAPDFMNGNDDDSSLDTSPVARTDSNAQYNLVKAVNSEKDESREDEKMQLEDDTKITLTQKNWDSVDSKTRQRLLTAKKKEMLLKAREAFLSKESKI